MLLLIATCRALTHASATIPKTQLDAVTMRDENSNLRAENWLRRKLKILELEAAAAAHASDVKAAEAAVHMSYVPKMEAQFHKGAAFASQVASGGVYTYTPPSAAGHT